jgi:hypothetical protein
LEAIPIGGSDHGESFDRDSSEPEDEVWDSKDEGIPAVQSSAEAGPASDDLLLTAAGAVLGLAVAGTGLAVRAARKAAGIVSVAVPDHLHARTANALRSIGGWNDRWEAVRLDADGAAETLADALVPRIATALLDRINVTEVILQRIDLEVIVTGLNLNEIAERLDLTPILDRLDFERIIERVDVNGLLERIDLDAMMARIDVNAIIDRLDVPSLAREAVEAIDLPDIVHESSATLATEAVDDIRLKSIAADRVVARAVDRLLRRRAPVGEPAPESPAEP